MLLMRLYAKHEFSQDSTTILRCDSRNAIQIAHKMVSENECHFIHHHLQSSTLHFQSIFTFEQPNIDHTKALFSTCFNQLHCKLKMVSYSTALNLRGYMLLYLILLIVSVTKVILILLFRYLGCFNMVQIPYIIFGSRVCIHYPCIPLN